MSAHLQSAFMFIVIHPHPVIGDGSRVICPAMGMESLILISAMGIESLILISAMGMESLIIMTTIGREDNGTRIGIDTGEYFKFEFSAALVTQGKFDLAGSWRSEDPAIRAARDN